MSRSFNVVETYVGDGNTDSYTFDFVVESETYLLIKVWDDDGELIESVRGDDTSFLDSVTLSLTGGTVLLDDDLPAGYTMKIIFDNNEPAQPYEFRNKFDFTLKRIEQALDYFTGSLQGLWYWVPRTIKLSELDDVDDFEMSLPADAAGNAGKVIAVNEDGDGFMYSISGSTIVDSLADAEAAQAAAEAAQAAAELAEANAETAETLAEDWATKTSGVVASAEYSSKAYAVGGTGIDGVANKGAAKNWATKITGTVDDTEYSAKAYALGGTGIDGITGKGAAKNWATKVNGTVDDADYSSKAYAIGGTGVTTTSGKGAAKEWATTTGGAVDTSEFSAKEYAVGTVVTGGSAKDWAQKTSAAVTASLYSAKEWATGILTRSVAGGGSAKDWANYLSGTVDDTEYSAKYYAALAASAAGGVTPVITGTRAAPSAIVALTGIAFVGTSYFNIWFVEGSGGAVDIAANPQIAAGSVIGQRLTLIGRNDTNTVKLEHGTGLALRGGTGAEIYLFADTIADFMWDGSNWVQIGT